MSIQNSLADLKAAQNPPTGLPIPAADVPSLVTAMDGLSQGAIGQIPWADFDPIYLYWDGAGLEPRLSGRPIPGADLADLTSRFEALTSDISVTDSLAVADDTGFIYIWTGSEFVPAPSAPTGLPITAADEAARLALVGLSENALVLQEDTSQTWILDDADDPSNPDSWLLFAPTGLPIPAADEAARLALTGVPDGAVVDQGDVGLFYLLTDEENPSDPEAWLTLFTSAQANALVPEDASILPPQAFVDNIEKFFNNTVDASTQNITLIGITLMAEWAQLQISAGETLSLNLNGNQLTIENVDIILSELALDGGVGGTLDLSGQTPPAPPTTPTHEDGVWTLTVTGVPVGSFTLADFDGNIANPTFGIEIDVSSGDPDIIAQATSDYLSGVLNGSGNVISNVITFTVSSDVNLPLSPNINSATNLTIDDTSLGVAAVNPDVRTLEANGWTVTTD